MTVEEGLLGRPVGLVNEGLQSQPVGNNRSRERPTHARQQAGAQAGARARAVPVSFPVDGAERVTFQVPGNDLRWVAHVLDALAHRWGEASAEMPEGRVRTKKGRGGGLRKLIVVEQIEDDLRRKLDPKDRSWRVRIADGGWSLLLEGELAGAQVRCRLDRCEVRRWQVRGSAAGGRALP